MNTRPPPEDRSPLDEDITELRQALREMKQELATLRERARVGDATIVKQAMGLVGEIRKWLLAVRETEARFEERRKRKEGIAHEYALDLEQARIAIRSRLDRLRKSAGAGGIPRSPDAP